MPSNFFHFKNSTLHYTTLGNGPQNLFMFHGFGQDNNSYHALSNVLSAQYTAYIFDLYFHGESRWGYGEAPLEKTHWKETIEEFLKETGVQNFSLAGFSLGGKFALATLEAFPEKTKGIILLAPMELRQASGTASLPIPFFLEKFSKVWLYHPNRFQSIVSVLHTLGRRG